MIVSELYPDKRQLEIDPAVTPVQIGEQWYPKLAGPRFNFVLRDESGHRTNSNSISNSIDRYFLKVIRWNSDLIISTGETARSENLRASKYAPIAIISNHPDDLGIPATLEQSGLVVAICSRTDQKIRYPNSNTKFIKLQSTAISESISEVIDSFGSTSPVVEVGPTSAQQLARVHFFDEICLTVASSPSELSATQTAETFLKKLGAEAQLLQLLCSNETYFFRFRVLK